MAESVHGGCEPPQCESSFSDTGQTVPDPIRQSSTHPDLSSSCQQTIEEKLNNMPMEEYKKLLDGCKDKSKVKTSEQAEIISQLEHQTKVQPEEEIPTTLANSKYSSSLQSLSHERGKSSHPRVNTSSSNNNNTTTTTQNSSGTTAINRSVIGGDHYHHHHPTYHHPEPTPELFNCQTTTSTTTITTASLSSPRSRNSNHNNNINIISSPFAASTKPIYHHPQDIHVSVNDKRSSSCDNNKMDSMNNLPVQYLFNCAQQNVFQPLNNNLIMRGATQESQLLLRVDKSVNSFDLQQEEDPNGHRNKVNVQLNENYTSVSSVTQPKFSPRGQLDNCCRTEVCSNDTNAVKSHSNNMPAQYPVSPTPNISSSQHQGFSTSPSQNNSPPLSLQKSGSALDSRKGDDKKGGKKKKFGLRETSITPENIPGFRGNEGIDALLVYVEGAAPTEKRGNKKKERESRVKTSGNETLVKSVSLDEDNLSLATKKSVEKSDNNNRSSSLKVLKDVPNTTSATRSQPQGRMDIDKKVEKGFKEIQSSGVKKSVANQGIRKDSGDQEDKKSPLRENADPNFTVVIRRKNDKRRNKTASSASETGSSGDKDVHKESRRSGERRKSVGSVPGSDQSEGSDDGSVRSLPAGKCTQRENVPKSSASSGGTPQTSYADIARLTKDEEAKQREVPQMEDYPLLHASEISEGSDRSDDSGSVRSLPVGEVTPKEVIKKSSSTSSSSSGAPHTSYADIARSSRLSFPEEKRELFVEKKGDHPADDFPELMPIAAGSGNSQSDIVTATEIVSCSSPGDSSSGSSKYANDSVSAFPKLSASGSQKSSQGPPSTTSPTTATCLPKTVSSGGVSQVNMNNQQQKLTTTTNSAVLSNSAQAKVYTQKVVSTTNNNINSSVGVMSSHSPTAAALTTTNFPAVIVNTAKDSTTTTANTPSLSSTNISEVENNTTPASVLNSSSSSATTTISINPGHGNFSTTVADNNNSDVVNINSMIRNGKRNNTESPANASVNGHLSDPDLEDNVFNGIDNVGAKSNSAFIPPQGGDQGVVGPCTEAVVFCGENFKEPPQPSENLQFEFGFDVNEELLSVGMSKNVFEFDDKLRSPKKQATNERPHTLARESNEEQQQPSFSSSSKGVSSCDKVQPPPQPRGSNQSVRMRNQPGFRDSRNSPVDENRPRSQDSRHGPSSSSTFYQDGKTIHHNVVHTMKKPGNQSEGVNKTNVAQPPQQQQQHHHHQPEFSHPAAMVVTSIPLAPLHSAGMATIPSAVYGAVPGYIPVQGAPAVSGIIPVQMPSPVPYDVYQRAPVAAIQSLDEHNKPSSSTSTTPIQSQQYQTSASSNIPVNTLGAGTPSSSRQFQQVSTSTKAGSYHHHHHQVPDFQNPPQSNNIEQQTTSEQQQQQQQQQPVDYRSPSSIQGVIVLEYPVNFGQYYYPPSSNLYMTNHYQELSNYLDRTTRTLEQQFTQSDPKRCRRVT